MINLISNALKFTLKGYVKVKISANYENSEHLIKFDVIDTGIGIK